MDEELLRGRVYGADPQPGPAAMAELRRVIPFK